MTVATLLSHALYLNDHVLQKEKYQNACHKQMYDGAVYLPNTASTSHESHVGITASISSFTFNSLGTIRISASNPGHVLHSEGSRKGGGDEGREAHLELQAMNTISC